MFSRQSTDREILIHCSSSCTSDNHKLIEWLAYNYHVMPMREIILIEDPKSTQKIDGILKRWEGRIQFTRWTDDDIFANYPNTSQPLTMIEKFRMRQTTHYAQCLKEFKRRGVDWVALTDDDEYMYVNPRVHHYFSNVYRSYPVDAIETPGSILSLLKYEQRNNYISSPCMTFPRYQFNAQESTSAEVAHDMPHTATSWMDPQQLYSFRWRYVAKLCSYGKNLINVAALSEEDIPFKTEWVHRNLPDICPRTSTWFTNEGNSVFLANHYMGTWEQYTRQGDSREADNPRFQRTFDRLQDQNRRGKGAVQDHIRPWLKGFVASVGEEDAKRLLEGAGVVGFE